MPSKNSIRPSSPQAARKERWLLGMVLTRVRLSQMQNGPESRGRQQPQPVYIPEHSVQPRLTWQMTQRPRSFTALSLPSFTQETQTCVSCVVTPLLPPQLRQVTPGRGRLPRAVPSQKLVPLWARMSLLLHCFPDRKKKKEAGISPCYVAAWSCQVLSAYTLFDRISGEMCDFGS